MCPLPWNICRLDIYSYSWLNQVEDLECIPRLTSLIKIVWLLCFDASHCISHLPYRNL